MSMNLMQRLQAGMYMLSVDRNVPEALRIAARKKVSTTSSGKALNVRSRLLIFPA